MFVYFHRRAERKAKNDEIRKKYGEYYKLYSMYNLALLYNKPTFPIVDGFLTIDHQLPIVVEYMYTTTYNQCTGTIHIPLYM